MAKNNRAAHNYNNKFQITKLLFINIGTTVGSLLLSICLLSILGLKMDLDEQFMYYFTYPVIALCAFGNGFLMARMIRVKGWLVGLGANFLFLLTIIISHFVTNLQVYDALFLIKIGVLLLCGVLGGIVGVNKKRKIR